MPRSRDRPGYLKLLLFVEDGRYFRPAAPGGARWFESAYVIVYRCCGG
jgi:hypothetical protein